MYGHTTVVVEKHRPDVKGNNVFFKKMETARGWFIILGGKSDDSRETERKRRYKQLFVGCLWLSGRSVS